MKEFQDLTLLEFEYGHKYRRFDIIMLKSNEKNWNKGLMIKIINELYGQYYQMYIAMYI